LVSAPRGEGSETNRQGRDEAGEQESEKGGAEEGVGGYFNIFLDQGLG
jgi:hypothetical protein